MEILISSMPHSFRSGAIDGAQQSVDINLEFSYGGGNLECARADSEQRAASSVLITIE